MKKRAIVLALMAFMLVATASGIVSAQSTIHFIPVGGVPTGTAPILTSNPGDCILSEQATGVTATNMWAVIIVDQATYDARAGATVTFAQKDGDPSFTPTANLEDLIPATVPFPPQTSGSSPWDSSVWWPGCNQQYNPSTMEAALGSANVYYMAIPIAKVLDGATATTNGTLVNGQNQEIIVTVSSSANFKVAVFLMAQTQGETGSTLDLRTPQTDSPLITTPEITTLVLIPVALGAVAIYIKKKQTIKA